MRSLLSDSLIRSNEPGLPQEAGIYTCDLEDAASMTTGPRSVPPSAAGGGLLALGKSHAPSSVAQIVAAAAAAGSSITRSLPTPAAGVDPPPAPLPALTPKAAAEAPGATAQQVPPTFDAAVDGLLVKATSPHSSRSGGTMSGGGGSKIGAGLSRRGSGTSSLDARSDDSSWMSLSSPRAPPARLA